MSIIAPIGVLLSITPAGGSTAPVRDYLPSPPIGTALSNTPPRGFDNAGSGVPSLLGNIQDCLPALEPVSKRRELLMNLQGHASMLADSSRVYSCLRSPVNPHGSVEVRVSSSGSMYYDGLMRCGLLWLCPCCGSKISELRRVELVRGVEYWVCDSGHGVCMVTYTLRHDLSMPLLRVLEALQGALDVFTNGRAYMALKDAYGVAGLLRASEVTHGKNGWHCHLHELQALDDVSSVDWDCMRSDYGARWLSSLASVGISGNSHALDVIAGSDASAQFQARYMSKHGKLPAGDWSIEQELTKSMSKVGHGDNRTPLDLLICSAAGDLGAGDLWREYVQGYKGKKQLRFSKGTRALFGLGGDVSDNTLANRRGHGELVGYFSSPRWSSDVVGQGGDRRVEFLRQAGSILNGGQA